MRAIFVGFDSLNRHYLPSYGGLSADLAPNFTRLAGLTAQFQNSYVSSMPCMPARRELHTARPNFLHRGWGPLEPFDDSVPEMLTQAGVYTHLITDHHHYFEDGGATYHNRYNSWELFRGQEGDKWFPHAGPMPWPEHALARNGKRDAYLRSNYANRMGFEELRAAGEEDVLPIQQTFSAGMRFLERHHATDNWMLQIETFDPHEPFVSNESLERERQGTGSSPENPLFDWPNYGEVTETRDQVEACRQNYIDSLRECDRNLGRLLDTMDAHDMWKDTMLIVWTDHGFFLGERNLWAKRVMPWWNEIARTPFFVWDPRSPEARGVQREALVQPSLDIPVTLLRLFKQEPTADMVGKDLAPAVARDEKLREAGIYGDFGGHVNITDGRYVYMRSTENPEVKPYQFTLMATVMNQRMSLENLKGRMSVAPPFGFTKGCETIRFGGPDPVPQPANAWRDPRDVNNPWFRRHLLYDLEADPEQKTECTDPEAEARMIRLLVGLMQSVETPPEQYTRLGLENAAA